MAARGRRPGQAVAWVAGAWFLVLATVVALGATVRPCGGTGFPRTANIYFPALTTCDAVDLWRLSRYDVVVVGVRNEEQAPEELATLRSLNPDNTILPHMCFSYHGDWTGPPILSDVGEALHANNWWLRDTDGEIYRVANGNGLVNITTNCPTNPEGQRLCDWLGDYLGSRLGPGGPWDGIFLDCVWDVISWAVNQSGIPIDSDLDGVADDLVQLDEDWREGTAIAVGRVRELVGEDYLIVTNGGNTLWDDVNGTTLEGFPEAPNGWYRNITDPDRGYIAIDTNYREPRFNIVNPNWSRPVGEDGPHWSGYFIKKFLFTLASTLVFGEGYYSINSTDYAETWWFLYYDLDLGEPLGPAQDAVASPGDAPGVELGDMIKLRRFSQGVATVNPTNVTQEVELQGTYYDPEAWNGEFLPVSSLVTSVEMGCKMGRVLVGTGAVPPAAMGLVSAAFDGSAVELWWQGPAWASRYAIYRRAVRGDGSTTERELVSVVDATTFHDTGVDLGRRYTYSVSPIDALKCEGWASDSGVVSTELTTDPWLALMVEDPGGMLVLTWEPPNVPGGMIFELERHDEKGLREWLGRFPAEAGETIRYADATAVPGQIYRYELFEVLALGRRLVASVRAQAPRIGGTPTALLGCHPQPVGRGSATISFRVGDDDNWETDPLVALTVYDIRGRVVRRLLDGPLARGDHSVVWDCRDDSGRPAASGCYLYALDVGGTRLMGKAVLIR